MNHIFIGHYGSGKTEVSVNFAIEKKKAEESVAIIDLDIVNPYYRTFDAKDSLEKVGIYVEAPIYANTNVDVPALTGKMGALMKEKALAVILDVGGDDLGTKAVGRYKEEILEGGYILYFVLNPFRPFTNNLESINKMFDEIEKTSKLKVSGIVNNSNMLEYTNRDIFLEGSQIVYAFASERNLPILFNSVFENTANELKEGDYQGKLLIMDEYIKLLWSRQQASF